jgi:hypothetical protein
MDMLEATREKEIEPPETRPQHPRSDMSRVETTDSPDNP